MKHFLVISSVAIFISGCTSIDVRQVDTKKYPISTICILKNPKVIVGDFLPVVEKGFNRHGIAVALYSGRVSKCCKYSLFYTARQRWDFATYLAFVQLEIRQHRKIIGSAHYHQGGLPLNKWRGTESKINPVIDELLSGFKLSSTHEDNPSECDLDNPAYVVTTKKKKPEVSQSSSIEIIESYGHIIFSKLPEKSRLRKASISIGDTLLSVNGVSVNKNNLESTKKALKDHELEISILGKGTARIRGYDVVKKF